MERKQWTRIFGAVAIATLGACNTNEGAPDPANDASLRRMQSCDDLKTRLSDVLTEQLVQSRYGFRGGVMEDGDLGAPTNGADDGAGGGETPTDYTGTNNQEEGVDELDLVKTNGTHLFVAQDRSLQIVKSWPAADAEKLATVELPGWANGLFLEGDKLVVFTQLDGSPFPGDADGERGWYPATRVLVIDVSSPESPQIVQTVDIDGWLTDARLVGDEVTFVLNQYMQMPQSFWDILWQNEASMPAYPTDWEDEAALEAAEAQARSVLAPLVEAQVQALDLAELLPRWREETTGAVQSMYACEDLYAPATLTPLSMLSVVQLDPETGELGSTGLLSDGWTIYASAQNLYVAQTSQWWWGYEDEGLSHIHKFSLQSGTEPAYLASGVVKGWLYDQFAMSEFDGHLRVATTDLLNWWNWSPDEEAEEPANNVIVLADDGAGNLATVGSVGGIAPTERIMAVRMMGEKAYVVTFRNTDPLFTIDLSNPADPKVVGELVMPGYSAYLHPVGEDHLLAVGMAGLDTGELTGLAVTFFDVSDMADPKIKHQHEVAGEGWAWSEALWDHHAFTYHRDTLTIPAFTESWDEGSQTWSGFSGTISFHATVADGIEEVGRVDHRDLVDQSECLWDQYYGGVTVDDGGDRDEEVADAAEGGGGSSPGSDGETEVDPSEPPDDGGVDAPGEPYDPCGWEYAWYAQVRRSVYIEDELFTISNYGIKVNSLTDPSEEHARVLFFPESAPE